VFSFEQALLDAELFGMVCHMLDRGFPVNDETLAYEAIAETGPGGHFLGHPHTLAHMREKWTSTFFGTESWEDWEGSGRREPKDRAREKARRIVAEHVPERLPDDVDAACRAIVERRRKGLERA
jgi:trimethylamine--corrinoid protein Co-methyltransferase